MAFSFSKDVCYPDQTITLYKKKNIYFNHGGMKLIFFNSSSFSKTVQLIFGVKINKETKG